jgi:hypothetical protein
MSQLQALRGSGPTFTGTLYSEAQAAASAAALFVPGGAAAEALPTWYETIVNVTAAPTSRRRALGLDMIDPQVVAQPFPRRPGVSASATVDGRWCHGNARAPLLGTASTFMAALATQRAAKAALERSGYGRVGRLVASLTT